MEYKIDSLLILVVDDIGLIRMILSEQLKFFGHNTFEARNGLEAVNIYELNFNNPNERKIDGVIMDINMPVMCGDEAINQISKINEYVRVIVNSGYNECWNDIKGLLPDTQCIFMNKPYKISDLKKNLNLFIQQ